MLLKCHYLSLPLVESNLLLNQMNDEFCFLENLNMTIGTRHVSHRGFAN
jgi:hypothetical protein